MVQPIVGSRIRLDARSKDPRHSTRNASGKNNAKIRAVIRRRIAAFNCRCRTECQRGLQTSESAAANVECLLRTAPHRSPTLFRVAERALGFPLAKTNDTMERSANPPLRRQFRLTRRTETKDRIPWIEAFGTIASCPRFPVPPHYSPADYIENACYGIHA